MATRLEQEIRLYESKRVELLDEHRNEYVLIKGDRIVGFFADEVEGLEAGYKTFADEPFLLRRVEEATTPVLFTSLYMSV